jgi:hypothetical protein
MQKATNIQDMAFPQLVIQSVLLVDKLDRTHEDESLADMHGSIIVGLAGREQNFSSP